MQATLGNLNFSIDVGAGAPSLASRPSPRAPGRRTAFGYDATEDCHRRKAPYALLRCEDDELPNYKRQQVITLGRDIRRNFAIAAWAIRRHLDYVARFRFRSLTGIKQLDTQISELIRWSSRPENFDAARRHGLRKYVRLVEASRAVDGDLLSVLRQNGRLQAIEADRVRTPITYLGDAALPAEVLRRMRYGVVLDDDGAAMAYAVNQRGPWYTVGPDLQAAPNSFTFERLVPARNCILTGYFERFDQVRGISPVLAALNSYRDVYEGFDYALAQAKVAQLFALVIKRNSLKALQEFEESEGPTDYRKHLDFNRGPALLDLDPADTAEFLQSNNPSSNWQSFINIVIAVALKSFDIPYSFFDESHTNYSGSRGAWLMYDQSAEDKADDLRENFLDRWTAWRLGLLIYWGLLELPAGFDAVRDLKWTWIRKRIPWIDPLKEIQAARQEIAAGITCTPMVAESTGNDAFEMVDQEAAYQEYRVSKNLPRTDYPLAPVPVTINEAEN